MESIEKIIESFRRNGFRATPQRIAIAKIVSRSKDHPTAEQVFEIVKRIYPSISLSRFDTVGLIKDLLSCAPHLAGFKKGPSR